MLLAPLLYVYTIKKRVKNILGYFIIAFVPFFILHLYIGVDLIFYSRSLFLVLTVYLFGSALHAFIKTNAIESYFPFVLKLNFFLVLLALILYFTPYAEAMWTFKNLTKTIQNFPRLELFTYEPSYYSLLLSPIVIYYVLHLFLIPTSKKQLTSYLLLIFLPLALSLSFGVLGGILVAFLMLVGLKYSELKHNKYFFFTFWGITILLVLFALSSVVIFPNNPITGRIIDLFRGNDTSASGRTTNALWLAHEVAAKKSLWFGGGLGQIKVLGAQVIKDFYNYSVKDSESIAIPNSIGETIAMFGYVGLGLKLFLQLFLYQKTKVSSNYYRLTIFIFVFLYQFTGSFFNNTAEVTLWVIAFTPCCPKFNTSLFVKQPEKALV
jgi:hypothetical protein